MLIALFIACSTPATDHEAAPEHAPAAEAHAEQGHEAHATTEKAAVTDGWAHYGDAFTVAESADCAGLIGDPAASVDKTVRVNGRIENVCQKAGCWMVVADEDGNYLRITMKDHAFGVPTDTATGPGTRVDVEGTLIAKQLDPETLAHLKSEAKGDEATLAEQFAPKYEIVATGVAVKQQG